MSGAASAAGHDQAVDLGEPWLGLVPGLSNEDYHADEAVGSTGLRRLARTPLHYYGQTLDPNRPQADGTDDMRFGSMSHCLLLEPEAFAERYAVRPPGLDLRTREGRAWAETIGKREPVLAKDYAAGKRQVENILAHPEVGPLLSRGQSEVSAFWMDPVAGVRCKCRPDRVSPVEGTGVVLLDLKTCQDASERGFARSIWNYRYDIQAAFYSDGYERASGLMVLGFVFIAVEKEWPHAVGAWMLDDVDMDRARGDIARLLALYAKCREADEWPGYEQRIRPISLPAWADYQRAE